MSQPIVFFGTEDFSAASLEALIAHGFLVELVITKPDTKSGRGQKITPPQVKKIAQLHNIRVLQPAYIDDIIPEVEKLDKPCGVLVSFGKIIPRQIIDLFAPGIINVHPSLLPKYRGPSPIESAIKNQDPQTGISIMQLDSRMDAGGIYAQKIYVLSGNETKPELYTFFAQQGAELLIAHLPAIISGALEPTPQNETIASYCGLIQKKESLLQPDRKTASELAAQIRAHLGYPKSKITLFGHEIIITSASVVTESTKKILVIPCKNDTFLEIKKVIAPNGKTMSGVDFSHGYAN